MKGQATRVAALPCAVYTRKSSEEGLEQGFNSLDAQREACAAFIQSQKALGWVATPVLYDDGGFSGGNMDRPGLRQLLADISARRIKIIVVYKVDRLTRSLADFAKLVELFDAHGVSFVSVTQQFNTTSSMGRLTLNVLLSFAQFEREVTGERIRDKIAASKRRGMWMGGLAPIGYLPHERTLVIDETQAERVRQIYQRYLNLGCVRKLKGEIDGVGWLTPERQTRRSGAGGCRPFSRGHLYRILSNPIYIGQIAHKDEVFPGNHPAIVTQDIWQAVQGKLASNRQGHRTRANVVQSSLLAGMLVDGDGNRLTPTHAKKGTRRYRYYVGSKLNVTARESAPDALRIPAQELEDAVVLAMVNFLGDESKMLDWIGDEHEDGSVTANVGVSLHRAAVLTEGLKRSPVEFLPRCLGRVVVSADQIEIGVRRRLLDDVNEQMANDNGDGKSIVDIATDDLIWLTVPAQLKRCGMAMRLIVAASAGSGTTATRGPDAKMVALLAKARKWFDRLACGRFDGVGAIARAEGVGSGYVTRVIYLAFLAPDIVQAITHGKHPLDLNADRLMRIPSLPTAWEDQRRLLGFDGQATM